MAIVLAVEDGTHSTKATLISNGKILRTRSSDTYDPVTRPGGYSRQHPKVWWDAFLLALQRVCKSASIDPKRIDLIAISGQMHGLVPNGIHIANLWNDSTAKEAANRISADAHKVGINLLKKTGNIMGPNMTAAKVEDMRVNEPERFARMEFFTLPAGSIVRRLIEKPVAGPSAASSTCYWDIQKRTWSRPMTDWLGVTDKLPQLFESTEVAGHVTAKGAKATGLNKGTPVLPDGADQTDGGLGMGILASRPGIMSFNIGTSAVILAAMHAANPRRDLNTFAHEDGGVVVFTCTNAFGDAQTWILKIANHGDVPENGYTLMDTQSAGVPVGSNGVMCLPFFSGSRALERSDPWASFMCMGVGTSLSDMFSAVHEGAVMEAVMFGLKPIIDVTGVTPHTLMLGGGGAKGTLPQKVADIAGTVVPDIKIVVPETTEATALGAGIRGCVAAGDFPNLEAACDALVIPDLEFHPDPGRVEQYAPLCELFVERAKVMRDMLNS